MNVRTVCARASGRRTPARTHAGRPRRSGRIGAPSMRSGAATTVRSMCWTMCAANETAAYLSTGEASATRSVARPRRKTAVRQSGQGRRIRATPTTYTMAASAVARETIRADIERRAGHPRGASPPALSVSPRRSREIELEPQCAVHHDRDEEQREVEERIEVHRARHGPPAHGPTAQKPERVRDEERAEDDRSGEVDVAEPPGDEEQQGERQQARRVREDAPRCCLVTAHDGKHRNAGTFVVVADE